MSDKVSIILIHYNQLDYVKEAIESVLRQKHRHLELIFADDASKTLDLPDLKKFCQTHNKNHVKIIWQINQKNLGTVKNVNLAIKKATGDYVLIFAADDKLYSDDTISEFVKSFKDKDKSVAAVFGQCLMMDRALKKLKYKFIDPAAGVEFNKLNSLDQFKLLSTDCFIAMGATMFRMDALKKVGLFDEQYQYIEDWSMFLKLTQNNFRLLYDNEICALLHRDGGISHRDPATAVSKHHIGFEQDLYNILANEVFPKFKIFSQDEKLKIIKSYQDRKNNLESYHQPIDDRPWKALKKQNSMFFVKNRIAFSQNKLRQKIKPQLPTPQPRIKVVFLAQYIQGYNKFANVVKTFSMDPLFDVKVVAFPYHQTDFPKNKEFNFWYEKFDDLVINAIDNGEWIDLNELRADYIFIQRPYDIYLPDQFSLANLAKVAKVCYIPYGYSLKSTDSNKITLNKDLLDNLSIFFADNTVQADYMTQLFSASKQRAPKILNLGYPFLDEVKQLASEKNKSAFSQFKKDQKILWTPRWTTSDVVGGSTSFFKYKDEMISFCKKRSDVEFVFRPHPLAFENFVKEGLMTTKEVDKYLANFDDFNMVYDQSVDYHNTFKDADVLITDYSSIIIEFFFFNKPIIFCDQNVKKFSPEMIELSKCFYHADNWRDIKKHLSNLQKGQDPLKPKREKVLAKYSRIYDGHVCDRIADAIKEDYMIK